MSQVKRSQHSSVHVGSRLVCDNGHAFPVKVLPWKTAEPAMGSRRAKSWIPYSCHTASPGLPPNSSARSNGSVIFSQEKLIFFEQIQPMGVTHYISTSAKVPAFALLGVPWLAKAGSPRLRLRPVFLGNNTRKKGRRSLVGLPKAGSLRVRSSMRQHE